MRPCLALLIVASALLGPSAAAAEPPDLPSAVPSEVQDGADPPPPTRHVRATDGGVDHGFTMSHAETLGAGKVGITAYELLFLALSVGIGDDFQLTLSGLVPIEDAFPVGFGALQAKVVLDRSDRSVVAARASAGFLADDDFEDFGPVVSFGVLADSYLTADGAWSFHLALDASLPIGEDPFDEIRAFLTLQLGLKWRVASWVALVAEASGVAVFESATPELFDVVPLSYGVRMYGDFWSVDFGFTYPVGLAQDELEDFLVLGVPTITFGFRL